MMSQSTLEDQFYDFDRLMSLGGEDEYMGQHMSAMGSPSTTQPSTVFDSRPSPELLEKYTDIDFANAIQNHLKMVSAQEEQKSSSFYFPPHQVKGEQVKLHWHCGDFLQDDTIKMIQGIKTKP